MSVIDHDHELAVADNRPDRAGQLPRILALPRLEHNPDSGNRLGHRKDEITQEPAGAAIPVLQVSHPTGASTSATAWATSVVFPGPRGRSDVDKP